MTTRVNLRRRIGAMIQEPFFRMFGGEVGTTSGVGTTLSIIDTALLNQGDNYWRGNFVYFPSTNETRLISGSNGNQIVWLAALASAPASGATYEIWSHVTPNEVHEAINSAIRQAWPAFFQYGVDETLFVLDDLGLDYTLPVTMKRLCEMWLILYQSTAGSVTSTGTNVQLIDSSASFTSADVGKAVTIYGDASTANGDYRTVSSVDSSTQITVSSAFTQILPVGADYRLLDINNTVVAQTLLANYRPNREDTPTSIRLHTHLEGYEGYPFRIEYEAEHTELSAESDDTGTLPDDYVISAALAQLYMTMLTRAPASEIQNTEALAKLHAAAADKFMKTHYQQHKGSQFLRYQSVGYGRTADYPF